jgi:hypothetical protein
VYSKKGLEHKVDLQQRLFQGKNGQFSPLRERNQLITLVKKKLCGSSATDILGVG